MELKGRVAVITGAGSGIGAATAAAFHARGCRVALVDIHPDPVREVAARLPGATWHPLDVSDGAAMEALASEVVKVHGGVNIIVNNAGLTRVGSFEHHSAEDWRRVVDVNLHGVVNGCRVFLPHLRAADRGWIVNLSSMFGLVAFPGQSAYCATKYAVRGLSESLAEELRGSTIGVSVVHPGAVATGIVKHAHRAAHAPADVTFERLIQLFERRGVPPERVAEAIVSAIRHERLRVRVCREAIVSDLLKRLMPELGNRLVVSAARRLMPPELHRLG